jgi:hypothetical protein
VVAATLTMIVRAPERKDMLQSARGHRVLRIAPRAVRGIEVTLGERHLAAHRSAGGWEVDGRPASPRTAEALGDLIDTLARLRAVDAFRPRDTASFGLERPRATVVVTTPRGARRLFLGDANSAASAVYARRNDDPRVLLVGIMLLSELERVFYSRDPATAP